MSLARGEALVPEAVAGTTADSEPAVVIAIAASMDERLRVARIVSPHAPLLLVASREEALQLLARGNDELLQPVAAVAPVERIERVEPVEHVEPVAPVEPDGQPAAVQAPVATSEPPRLVDGVEVDSEWRTMTWQGSSVALSPLEHDLLLCLLDLPLRTWTFELLHRTVWGNDHLAGRDDVQSVVKRLRRKLRDIASPLGIRAVRGVGLRIVDHREPVPVHRSAALPSRAAATDMTVHTPVRPG
jgi:DNA-binding winged helix-turn-helix (wHTH) protein